jgi:hypothetical protein
MTGGSRPKSSRIRKKNSAEIGLEARGILSRGPQDSKGIRRGGDPPHA